MINIAKMRSITENSLYVSSIDSYQDYVTVLQIMEQLEPHLLMINGYLCTLLTIVNDDGSIHIILKQNEPNFVKETILVVTLSKSTPNEAFIRVEKEEVVNRLNIVDILYEINNYFSGLKMAYAKVIEA